MAVRRRATESGSDDFSVFHPGGFPEGSDSVFQNFESTGSQNLKAKVGWFSRKPKGGGYRKEFYEDESEGRSSRRNIQLRKQRNRNSLPSYLSLPVSSGSSFSSGCKGSVTCTDCMEIESECEIVTGPGEKSPTTYPVSTHSVFNLKEDEPCQGFALEPAVDAVSPLAQSPVSVVPFIDPCCSSRVVKRRGSFEYDHLEDFDPIVDSQMIESQDNSYVVALQLNQAGKGNLGDPQLCSQPIEPIPVSAPISKSIPGHLNLDADLLEVDTRRLLFQWNSVSVLPTKDVEDGPCHCPCCCSCGSSQRRLTTSVRNGCEAGLSFLSSRFLELIDRKFPRQACPLKRYGSDKSFTKQHLQMKSASPFIQQGAHFAGQCKFQSAKEYSSDQVVVEDDAKGIGLGGSGFSNESDTHSMQSTVSTRSFATTTTSASVCCDRQHIPYSKGVSGSAFKDRMEVSWQLCLCSWSLAKFLRFKF